MMCHVAFSRDCKIICRIFHKYAAGQIKFSASQILFLLEQHYPVFKVQVGAVGRVAEAAVGGAFAFNFYPARAEIAEGTHLGIVGSLGGVQITLGQEVK